MSEMSTLYIRTTAYNSKSTFRRAIESVLNQTYKHFVFYICENGSTDGGDNRRILEEYAKSDKRIVPFYNGKNRVFDGNESFRDLAHNMNGNDIYCTLDADDEYSPTFLEEMLALMKEHDLDIACCGSDFLSVANKNMCTGQRLLGENLLLEDQLFTNLFPLYHQFMRTVWGKLFKGYTLRNTVVNPAADSSFPFAYGADTHFTLRAFRDAKRVGILAKSLHKYYMSPKSVSYVIHPQRVRCDQILHEDAVDFLSGFGPISQRNWDFMFIVYTNALNDTLKVLLNADISVAEKIDGLSEMCSSEHTKELAARENFGAFIRQAAEYQKRRAELFTTIAKWLLSLEEVPDEKVFEYCEVGEFVCAAAGIAEGWVFFKKLHTQLLIENQQFEEAQPKLEELLELL